MSEIVVDIFQPVHVDGEKIDEFSLAAQLVEFFVESSAVQKTGQRVADVHFSKLAVHSFQLHAMYQIFQYLDCIADISSAVGVNKFLCKSDSRTGVTQNFVHKMQRREIQHIKLIKRIFKIGQNIFSRKNDVGVGVIFHSADKKRVHFFSEKIVIARFVRRFAEKIRVQAEPFEVVAMGRHNICKL